MHRWFLGSVQPIQQGFGRVLDGAAVYRNVHAALFMPSRALRARAEALSVVKANCQNFRAGSNSSRQARLSSCNKPIVPLCSCMHDKSALDELFRCMMGNV